MADCGPRFAAGDDPASRCNLERFLEATTPVVRTHYYSKWSTNDWRQSDEDNALPFFNLGDLWDAFRECSAYGTAVPIVLNGCGDGVVQYYVPYLSAIQLYGGSRRHFYRSRTSGEESDSDYGQDTGSEEASDVEHKTSPSTDAFSAQDTFECSTSEASSEEGEPRSCHEQLILEFLESEPPYQREPLADKISSLAKRFPELRTLWSSDLSPASWMSIAWYPIYRIPSGPTLGDLDACFLTYHSLSMQFTGGSVGHSSRGVGPAKATADPPRAHGAPVTTTATATMWPLPAFAMASYRLKAAVWAPGGSDQRLAASLSQAADAWVGLLRLHHPDHRFFAARRGAPRR